MEITLPHSCGSSAALETALTTALAESTFGLE